MLLKIILVIVFVKMLTDHLWIKEGLLTTLDPPPLNPVGDDSDKTSMGGCSINIVFPNPVYYTNERGEKVLSHYDNANNYMNNNYLNLTRAANPNDC